jgi:hypothetical protein
MSEQTPPEGWYDDPTMVNTRRYWDGQKWTTHRQEKPPPSVQGPATTPAAPAVDEAPSNWITWGYLCAVFLPPLGLIIGISRLGIEPKWAWKTIGISLAVMFVGLVLYLINNP